MNNVPNNEKIALFWLKIDEVFLKDQSIRKLERINESYIMSYIRLCVYSLKFNGKIIDSTGEDLEDWFIEDEFKIESSVDFMDALINCKLVREDENGCFLVSNIDKLSQKVSKDAVKKRRQRTTKGDI